MAVMVLAANLLKIKNMKYLKISNKGELDIRLIALMGGTTKIDDPNKIGQFGTGLKYAISYLVRTENKFKLFIGVNEIAFESRDETISDHQFKEIYFNGKSMGITTRYGYQWKAWEVLREIWCNAKDEGEEIKEIAENDICGLPETTSFFIELTEDIQQVLNTWDEHFLQDTPLYEDDNVGIYLNQGTHLKLYKNRVLIHIDAWHKSKFIYDFKQANLNELRQYMGYAPSEIAKGLLYSNKDVIELLLLDFKNHVQNDRVEFKLDFTYVKYDIEHVKDLFSGYLFLHPESDRSSNAKSVQVNKSLFELLQKCGLPTETVFSERGRSYSDSGFGVDENTEIIYSEITDNDLENRIKRIAEKYKVDLPFEIVTPKDSDFEILVNLHGSILFSYDLKNQSDADLEAIVLIAIFQEREGNIFKALKRLIKFARSNKAFERIFFGEKLMK